MHVQVLLQVCRTSLHFQLHQFNLPQVGILYKAGYSTVSGIQAPNIESGFETWTRFGSPKSYPFVYMFPLNTFFFGGYTVVHFIFPRIIGLSQPGVRLLNTAFRTGVPSCLGWLQILDHRSDLHGTWAMIDDDILW